MGSTVHTIAGTTQKAVNILGLPVNPLTMEQLLALVDRCIESREQILLGVVNAAKIVNARKDARLRQSLEEADLILADGAPIVWLSKLINSPLPERVAGIDIMYRILERASDRKYGIYLLGAKVEVLEKAAERIRNDYPGARIAGYKHGYFEDSDGETVARDIRESHADVLFVAMSSPKKENFLRKWRALMGVPVCHGVGGSFDILAGVTKRAPVWMQKCGLEWFYRFIQEPERMWKRYLVTNAIFIKLCTVEIAKAQFSRLRRKWRRGDTTNAGA